MPVEIRSWVVDAWFSSLDLSSCAAQQWHEPDLLLAALVASGLCPPLGRGLSIRRAALDASTVSRFIGVSRFVP
jgi:hypothetical protein